MNDFLYQEILTEEYRREQMAVAEKHNQYAHLSESKVTIFAYWSLSKLGVALENLGYKLRVRYENLAINEKHAAMPNLAE